MKKLIYQDEKAINKTLEERKQLNELIERFMFFLNESGIKPKKEYIVNSIEGGTHYIYSLLLNNAKDEIKRLKINSTSIQKNMLAGIEVEASNFKGILGAVIDQKNKCGISTNDLSFQENKPVISASDKEQIKNLNSIFIENEKQERIWNLQVEFAKAFNKFEDGLKDVGLNSCIYYGKPEKTEDYLLFKLKDGAKVLDSGMEEISGFPRSGGVIIEPNPIILK
jgi:hypothetical protein